MAQSMKSNRLARRIANVPILGPLAKHFYYALRGADALPTEVTCEMLGGYKLLLQPARDEFERRMYRDREYEPATLSLLDKVLRPGDTMVDVGANLGLMSIHAAQRVTSNGRVVAIEPHPVYFKRLVDNVSLNGIKNVVAVNSAAGSAIEQRTIYDSPDVNIGRSSLIDPGVGGMVAGQVTVDTLDHLLSDARVRDVRLLKIDVEGFELEVLKGASETLKQLPIICMEFDVALPTGGWDHFSTHDLLMETSNYSCYRFKRTKFHSSPLVEVTKKQEMQSLKFDNLVYVPKSLIGDLPKGLFA
ncbi:FkbM family methyltransferase [Bradyrhizobium sp. F1.13.3]